LRGEGIVARGESVAAVASSEMPVRWPLRNQILLPFSLVLLVLVATVSGLDAWLAAQRSSRQIEAQMRTIGESLKSASFPLTGAILAQAKTLSGADFALTDGQGNILASTLPEEFRPGALGEFTGPGPSAISTLQLQGVRYFHSAIRPRRNDAETQWLHILYPERAWSEARWQAALPSLLVGLGAVGVTIAVAYSIADQLSRPLHRLQQQVGRIAAGHFEELPLPERNDEILDLAVSVNSLVRELLGMTQAIQRSERLAVIGQLSGGLAHHLRNAITGARLAVQLHERACQSSDAESLQVANRQLRLTEEHLQRFLTAGQPQTPEKRSCRMTPIIEEVALLVTPLAKHHGTDFIVSIEPLQNATIFADSKLLEQMLLNVVLNAIEAAGPGGWVRIEGAVQDRQLVLRVFDSGPGPPQDLRARLFEPFATSKSEGVGLGLAAARRIAQAHAGDLTFAGDQPTCFEFTMQVEKS
jgi:signal transduction histidine kinase